MSQPAISKHLKVLERAGLVSRGRDAQRRPRRLEARPLAEATEWLERYRRFWEGSYQRLDALLDELKARREEARHARSDRGEQPMKNDRERCRSRRRRDREIVMTRVFDAPRRLVFDALHQARAGQALAGRPAGWTMPVCEIDLRVGGELPLRVARTERAARWGWAASFARSCRPSASSHTEKFDEAWYPGEAVDTTVLVEQGGKTTLTTTVLYESQEARDAVLKSADGRRASPRATTSSTGCWRRCRVSRPVRHDRMDKDESWRGSSSAGPGARSRGWPATASRRPRVRRARWERCCALAKRLGKDHALALALWKSGWYEARLLAALVDDPRARDARGR